MRPPEAIPSNATASTHTDQAFLLFRWYCTTMVPVCVLNNDWRVQIGSHALSDRTAAASIVRRCCCTSTYDSVHCCLLSFAHEASCPNTTYLRCSTPHSQYGIGNLHRASPSDLERWVEDVCNKGWTNFLADGVSSIIPRVPKCEERVCSQS